MQRKYIVVLILFCIALNAAGFLWKLFEPVLFYDEVAHFITPFTLVLILAEIIYRSGGDDEFFNTPLRAIITGSVIGLLGAAGWEGVEVLMSMMGISVSNALPDTLFDVFLGILGGAAGAWAADRYLATVYSGARVRTPTSPASVEAFQHAPCRALVSISARRLLPVGGSQHFSRVVGLVRGSGETPRVAPT